MSNQLEEITEIRLNEWAIWCLQGKRPASLGYASESAGFAEFIKREPTGMPVGDADAREWEIELIVSSINHSDPLKAKILRAEYRAHERYGNAIYENAGNDCARTHKQLGISQDHYRKELKQAKKVVMSHLVRSRMVERASFNRRITDQ